MLRIRSRHASTKSGESSRMKPARQISSIPRLAERRRRASLRNSAFVLNRLRSTTDVAIAAVARVCEAGGVRDCRRGPARSPPDSRCARRRGDQRGKVAAAAGDQDRGPPLRVSHRESSRPRKTTAASRRAARCRPSVTTRLAMALRARALTSAGGVGIDDEHHADPAIEGAEHLLLQRPDAASQRNTGGTVIAQGRSPPPDAAGSTRGMFSTSPPPVMWASALTAPVSRIAARQERT